MKSMDVRPNTITFTSLILAWTNSGDPLAAIKAEGYLDELTRRYEAGDESFKPHRVTFNAVIHSRSTSKVAMAVDRAHALLAKMKNLEASGHPDCSPDVITCTVVINVIARSHSKDKAVMANNILLEMDKRKIKPNDRTLGSVIMARALAL